jgi:replicative DNA helicase
MGDETISSERLPADLAAERAVLGGVLADQKEFSNVATMLQPDDFYHEGHAAIFEAFMSLETAIPPQPIDALTVTASLKAAGKLGLAGGPAYLAELEASVPTTANTKSYAQLVQDKAIKRRMIQTCRELSSLSVEPSTAVEDLLDEAQRRVFSIAERHQEGDLRPFTDVLDETLEKIDQLRASGGGVTGLPTGFADLDHMLTGFHPGELIILAARPGCGKTSLALNICCNASLRAGKAVAVFSLEMPQDQLAMRLLSSETRVDMKRIREGRLGQAHMDKITHAAGELWNAPLFIDDSGSLSSFDLRTKVRRLKSRLRKLDPPRELGLVMVDYLQLMHQRGHVESRQQEVQEISRNLKSLSKEMEVPILALSQLNRKVEERRGQKGKPMLSDLRESGAIEQDADVVMFIHREDADDEGGGGQEAASGQGVEVELIIAKQRNGPTGSVPLLLFSECTRFENKLKEGMVQ